jgi:L-ascorbate metabolism protein UlaG (beta-lactamase superfamily)
VTLTHGNHSSSAFENGTSVYLGESCGLVFDFGEGPKVYFAGDTNVFGDMALIARLYEPDVAVLPIGDHFTMGPREAAVALELLGVKRCVPSHYGTFPLLTGTPEQLRQLAPGVEILAPEPGGSVEL